MFKYLSEEINRIIHPCLLLLLPPLVVLGLFLRALEHPSLHLLEHLFWLLPSFMELGLWPKHLLPLFYIYNYVINYPDSKDKAAMFLKPLAMIIGTVASIGYPADSERPAMFLTPSWIFSKRVAGLKFTISSGRIEP